MPTLFPHAPVNLTERVRHITDIRKTANNEWRDSLADGDYVLEMSWIVTHAQAARMEGLYRSNAHAEWYVPLWQDMSLVETTINAAQTTISVNTNADYRAGGYAAIIHGDQSAEVCLVTSAAGGTLTLTTGPVATYSGTSWNPVVVAPVITGWAWGQMMRSDDARTSSLTARFVCPDPLDLSAAAYATFRSYDVVTDETVIYKTLEGGVSRELDVVANGFGHFDLLELEEFARYRGTISAVDTTHAARFGRRQFIHRCRGRDRPFWVSTWKNDLVLRSTVASAATTARVQRIFPVDADHVGLNIQFLQPSGTLIHREVTGAAAVGGDATSIDLTIAAPGEDVTTAAVTSLLHFVRFDVDDVAVEHTMGNNGLISHFSAPVVEIPYSTNPVIP